MSEQRKTADEKMWFKTVVQEPDIRFYDVRREPFQIYGLYHPRTEEDFKRMPDEIGTQINSGVEELYRNTAGGRVRFSTDSAYVAIRVQMPFVCHVSHMPLSGSAGFDLYEDFPETGRSRYYRAFLPPTELPQTHEYESIVKFSDRKRRYFTVHFPLYSDVRTLQIGLQEDAVLGEGMPYRDLPPVVYAGSSITQGACACRPGNAYSAIVSRKLGLDFINMGFSGSFRAEETMVQYLKALPMSVFVSDYDHNAPTAEHLRKTHFHMYEVIREAHPDLPYVMITRPDVLTHEYTVLQSGKPDNGCVARRDVIYESYRKAIERGDRHVYFLDGDSFFSGEYQDCASVDATHPNDYGMVRMADKIAGMLNNILFC